MKIELQDRLWLWQNSNGCAWFAHYDR